MKEEQEAPTEIGLREEERKERFKIGLCDISSSRRKHQPQNHQENHHDEKGHFRLGGKQVKPRKHWNLGNIVSMLRKLGNICCGHKMFLTKIRNIFCVPDTKFVSATNVARTGQRGNICVGNNVSATMCPRLPVPFNVPFLSINYGAIAFVFIIQEIETFPSRELKQANENVTRQKV